MDSARDIRAVVTDLDGTIVRADGLLSTTTHQAILALAAAGVPLIVATARTPAGLVVLDQSLSHTTTAICCNGSLGYEPTKGSTLWRHELAATTMAQIINVVVRTLPAAGIGAYNGQRWTLSTTYFAARGRWPRGPVQIDELKNVTNVVACALGICHPELTAAQIAEVLLAAGIGDQDVTFSYGSDDILDVTPPGVDKGTGVQRALALLGVDAFHAVAFGNAPNDLPMLGIVGHAVAVADAHPDVLAAVDAVTYGVAEDGFSHKLKQLGIIRLQ